MSNLGRVLSWPSHTQCLPTAASDEVRVGLYTIKLEPIEGVSELHTLRIFHEQLLQMREWIFIP